MVGFGLAALLAPMASFVFSILFGGGWAAVFELEGGAIGIALAAFLFLSIPGFVIGLFAMAGLLALRIRSPWFALAGIAAAALTGAYAEYGRLGELAPIGAMVVGGYVAIGCALTIAWSRRQIRTAAA